jgi:hypothetical protein
LLSVTIVDGELAPAGIFSSVLAVEVEVEVVFALCDTAWYAAVAPPMPWIVIENFSHHGYG